MNVDDDEYRCLNEVIQGDSEEMIDEDDHYVYNEKFGAIAPRVTGFISVFASGLILYIICISSTRLSTVYHRIMGAMSVADMLGSLAIGLTTIPMPKPQSSEAVDSYEFEGARFGNIDTCTVQGFFFIFGSLGTYLYNGSLCVYYACAIAFTMHESRIRKSVEPVLHFLPIGLGIGIGISPIIMKMYNPTPGSAWCSIRNLDYKCVDDCERGKAGLYELVINGTLALIVADVIVILISLFLVCRKVYVQSKMLVEYQERVDSSDFVRILTSRNRTIRIVMIQSLSYIAALFTTLLFPTLILLTSSSEGETKGLQQTVRKLHLIFEPLQGFFNLLIFVFSKVTTLRYAHPDISIWAAIRELFCRKRFTEEIIVITGINFVQGEDGNMEPERNEPEVAYSVSYGMSGWDSFISNPTTINRGESAAVSSGLSEISTEVEEEGKIQHVAEEGGQIVEGIKRRTGTSTVTMKGLNTKRIVDIGSSNSSSSDRESCQFASISEANSMSFDIDGSSIFDTSHSGTTVAEQIGFEISSQSSHDTPPIRPSPPNKTISMKKTIKRRANDKTKIEAPISKHNSVGLSEPNLSYNQSSKERKSSLRNPINSSTTRTPSKKNSSSVSFALDLDEDISLAKTANTKGSKRSYSKKKLIGNDDHSTLSWASLFARKKKNDTESYSSNSYVDQQSRSQSRTSGESNVMDSGQESHVSGSSSFARSTMGESYDQEFTSTSMSFTNLSLAHEDDSLSFDSTMRGSSLNINDDEMSKSGDKRQLKKSSDSEEEDDKSHSSLFA